MKKAIYNIICNACTALDQWLDKNDAFTNFLASGVCGLCSMMNLKLSYDYARVGIKAFKQQFFAYHRRGLAIAPP